MSATPLVSILLSARNAGNELDAALQSLRSQTLKDWEALLLNDGSTDNTRQHLCAAAANDSRFKVFQHDVSRGLTASLTELAEQSKAKFLARQDADDWSEPDRLEKQLAYLQEYPKIGVTGCYFDIHDADGNYLDTVRPFHHNALIKRL